MKYSWKRVDLDCEFSVQDWDLANIFHHEYLVLKDYVNSCLLIGVKSDLHGVRIEYNSAMDKIGSLFPILLNALESDGHIVLFIEGPISPGGFLPAIQGILIDQPNNRWFLRGQEKLCEDNGYQVGHASVEYSGPIFEKFRVDKIDATVCGIVTNGRVNKDSFAEYLRLDLSKERIIREMFQKKQIETFFEVNEDVDYISVSSSKTKEDLFQMLFASIDEE